MDITERARERGTELHDLRFVECALNRARSANANPMRIERCNIQRSVWSVGVITKAQCVEDRPFTNDLDAQTVQIRELRTLQLNRCQFASQFLFFDR